MKNLNWSEINFTPEPIIYTNLNKQKKYIKKDEQKRENFDEIIKEELSLAKEFNNSNSTSLFKSRPKKEKVQIYNFNISEVRSLSAKMWGDFVDHRAEMKKPLSKLAAVRVINKLKEFESKGFNADMLINTAIERRWDTVYEPAKYNFRAQSKSSDEIKSEVLTNTKIGFREILSRGRADVKVDGKDVVVKNVGGKLIWEFEDEKG